MAENFLNMKKKRDIQVQETERVPNKMNPETHTKTYHNESGKGTDFLRQEKTSHIQRKPLRLSVDFFFFLQKHCRPEGSGMIYLTYLKGKICNLEYSTQQSYHSKLMEFLILYRTILVQQQKDFVQ